MRKFFRIGLERLTKLTKKPGFFKKPGFWYRFCWAFLAALVVGGLFEADQSCAQQPAEAKRAETRRMEARKAGTRPEPKAMPEFAPVTDDPALPRVLLVGDSISIGYTLTVREALAGKANVHRPATNCGNTSKGLKGLSQWLGDGHWDVIHFNFGLHDVTSIDGKPEVTFDEYVKNMREIVSQLKETGATLVWCSTTPVPPARRAPLDPEDVVRYNEAAKKIMDENNIAIDDLYGFAMPQLTKLQQPTNVHPTAEGFKVLGQQVSASIEETLKQRAALKRNR